MIIKCVGAGEGKCPLQHMIHCTKFVLGHHCPHSCACSGNVWLVLLTSLHPFVSDGVPVLTDHACYASQHSSPRTFCCCQLLHLDLSSNISLLFLFAQFTSLEAQIPKMCKNTFSKHAGRFSKHALAVQIPSFAAQNSTRFFRRVWGGRFPKHAFALFSKHALPGGRPDS